MSARNNPTAEILARWPRVSDVAADVGVTDKAVMHWRRRQRIPADHFEALVAAAKRRGIALTYEELARSRARQNTGAAA